VPDLNFVLEHWPFVVAFGVFYVIGETMKRGPLSAQRAAEVALVRLVRRWFPLPLHPIVAGALLGLVPGVPVSLDASEQPFGPSLYYAGAGVLSVVWRNLYSEWKKFKKSED
jgi:hypothetical protein